MISNRMNKKVKGKVVKKIFGAGSKSEHDAITLVTEKGEFKLRRKNGNPFFDPELEKLVGKTIRCDGITHNYTFIMSDCEELSEEETDDEKKLPKDSKKPPKNSAGEKSDDK